MGKYTRFAINYTWVFKVGSIDKLETSLNGG